MKFLTLFVTTFVTCAINTQAYTKTDRRVSSVDKRQASSADQMVQNILQWLQGVYAQNSRRIRQGTLREYLPPSNTEKPRPFQPGYPPAGFSPQPPFPFPTNPATGGVTAPEGYHPDGDNDVLLPPEHGSGGGENGYSKPDVQPAFTLPTLGPTTEQPYGPTTTQGSEQPTGKSIPHEQPGATGQPTYTTGQSTLPTGLPTSPSEAQPGPFPTHAGSIPESGTTTTGQGEHSGYPESTPGAPFTSQPEVPSLGPEVPSLGPEVPSLGPEVPSLGPEVPSLGPEHSQPEGTPQVPQGGTTLLPASEQPQPTYGVSTIQPEGQSTLTHGELTPIPTGPGPTLSPIQPTTVEAASSTDVNVHPTSEQSAQPDETKSLPTDVPGDVATGEPAPGSTPAPTGTLVPNGFTTSTPAAPSETEKPAEVTTPAAETGGTGTTLNPEANTIPGPGNEEPSVVDDDDLKHPPHIHAIDVQCSKEMMTINIEFNREFNGVIYSKGYYNTPECRYVQENSGQTKYTFTVNLEMCGTEFVNAFDTQNQSYLENVLVLQNELGIQEVWDTVRSVRCLWEGNLKDTLSVAFSIGMLSQEVITFSGDTAMAKLDVVLGRGPFGEPANGLVKIGEQMTLVVSVSGDPGFDLQVKDCKAVDSEGKNSVVLTDEDGCILKPKLFGAFQKTRETGNSGASIIAYAHFNAFKFPDEMDLMIECNIELCKTDCDMCSKEGQQLDPAKRRRRRRDLSYNTTTAGDWVTMGKLVRVILPEDLNQKTALEVSSRDHICMTIQSFVFSTAVLVSLLVISSFSSVCLWMKRREKMYLKY